MIIFGDLLDVVGGIPGDHDYIYYCKVQAIIAGIAFFLSWIGSTTFEWAAERQLRRIRTSYFNSIMRQEVGWFDTFDSGTLNSTLNQNCVLIRDGIGVKLGQVILFATMFVGGYTVGFMKGWKLTLVLTAALPPLAAVGMFMTYAISTAGTSSQRAYATAGAVAEECLSNVKTVAAFGGEEQAFERYSTRLEHAFRVGVKGGLLMGVGLGSINLVMYLAFALGFWYSGKLVADDKEAGCNPLIDNCFMAGHALSVYFSVVFGAIALGQAGPPLGAFVKSGAASRELFAMIDRPSSIDPTFKGGTEATDVKGEIAFERVAFSYPTRSKPVFQKLNLRIAPGKTIAFVGASGCGKSTCIQFIERFYDIDSGDIRIDGRPIKEYNIASLRSKMAIVSQEPKLFADTIANNILFGRLSATKEEVEQAARDANAHDFITGFPDGYQTFVGEGGGQLSGGQKQRIAIARAILRRPAILILDEATSALDNESEKIVQATLDALVAKQARTTIIIAHRLTTIRNADVIAVFDNTTGDGAEIVEIGAHDELMGISGGLYRALVEVQEISAGDTTLATLAEVSERKETEISRKNSVLRLAQKYTASFDGMPARAKSLLSLQKKYSKDPVIVAEEEHAVETRTETACFCFKKKVPVTDKKPVSWFRVIKLLKPDAWKMPFAVFGAMVCGACWPVFAIVFGEFIWTYYNPDPQVIRDDSRVYALSFVGLSIAGFGGMVLQSGFFEWAGQRIIRELRGLAFHSVVYQEMSFFDNPKNSTGSLSTTLSADVQLVKGWCSDNTGVMVANITSIVVGIIIAFVASPELAAVSLAAFAVMAPASMLEMRALKGSTSDITGSIESPGYVMHEAISNTTVVAAFNLQSKMGKKYHDKVTEEFNVGVRKAFKFGLFFGWSQFAQYGAMALFVLVRWQDAAVYNNVSFTAEPGQTVALVGASGCGKSTIIQLLERFYDVEMRDGDRCGGVSVDGVDVRDFKLKFLRSKLGLVSQEPVLFDTSIGENIKMGNQNATMEEVVESAKLSNAHDFIMAFPDGYDTSVGKCGGQLSGGQKQRVAIARAMLRDPRVLLLDEATSALDSESEKVVQAALDKLLRIKKRTTIVIAHRLSTVRNADKIVVLTNPQRNGTIVCEEGTHEELVANPNGVYRGLLMVAAAAGDDVDT
eukprot:Polyplicarium_translucidae@DN2151_c0_g1_i3.p1